jgi:hypothetical protein
MRGEAPERRRAQGPAAHAAALVCASLVLSAALVSAASAAPCPASQLSFVTIDGWFASAAAVLDTSAGVNARLRFDFPAGEVGVHHCCGLGVTAVKAIDAFDVVGVAPGQRVTAVAEMGMAGMILGAGCGGSGCWGDLRGTITAGGHSNQLLLTSNVFGVDSVQVSGTVALSVTFTSGQPVTIEFMLEAYKAAGGENGAHGVGTIRFQSLPAGVRVGSCKGYAGVVPVRPTSWGQVKLLYR